MIKNLLMLILFFFISCSENVKEKSEMAGSSSTDKKEYKSIHQQQWEEHLNKDVSINPDNDFKIVIDDIISVTENSLGKFVNPKFSKDGKSLFFTSLDFGQIWKYNIENKTISKLVEIPQCGIKYQISPDSKTIYFRNKSTLNKEKNRVYSIMSFDVTSKKNEVIYKTKNRINFPSLVESSLYFLENNEPQNLDLLSQKLESEFKIPYFYVDNNNLLKLQTKLDTVIVSNKNLAIISSVYSRDYKNIIVQTEKNGLIILDLKGNKIKNMLNTSSVSLLQNSNLLVYSIEKDNGAKIVSSELNITFTNSEKILKLPFKDNTIRFSPDWSPIVNKIAYETSNKIKILSFNIEKIGK